MDLEVLEPRTVEEAAALRGEHGDEARLLAGGTAALNHFLERETDARMRRTEQRPLPAGRLQPARYVVNDNGTSRFVDSAYLLEKR